MAVCCRRREEGEVEEEEEEVEAHLGARPRRQAPPPPPSRCSWSPDTDQFELVPFRGLEEEEEAQRQRDLKLRQHHPRQLTLMAGGAVWHAPM